MKNRDNDVDDASILAIFSMVRQDISGVKGRFGDRQGTVLLSEMRL
jgi:hypothetical protein